MTIADAARQYGSFVGRPVAYNTWMAWERYADEPAARLPDRENMRGLFLFTRAQVRPDHFYQLEELRAKLAGDAAAAPPPELAAVAGG